MTPSDFLDPQPPTVPGEDQRPVWGLIILDLDAGRYEHTNPGSERWAFLSGIFHERDAFGARKYGHRLPVDSGRDSRKDELQEALDGMAYSRQTAEQELGAKSKAIERGAWVDMARHKERYERARARHLRCLQTVLELLDELGA
jgi:hypothetical protein